LSASCELIRPQASCRVRRPGSGKLDAFVFEDLARFAGVGWVGPGKVRARSSVGAENPPGIFAVCAAFDVLTDGNGVALDRFGEVTIGGPFSSDDAWALVLVRFGFPPPAEAEWTPDGYRGPIRVRDLWVPIDRNNT
jgi:hypothetical protein